MKYFLVIIAIILVVVVLLFLWIRSGSAPIQVIITEEYFERIISAMIKTDIEEAFCIFQIVDSDHFIQIRKVPDRLEIDFPQITPPQRNNRDRILAAFAKLKIKPEFNKSTDGKNEFIDGYVPLRAPETATLLKGLFQSIFQAQASTKYSAECTGFTP